MRANLSKEQQLVLGVEFLGLGYKYCVCGDRELISYNNRNIVKMSSDELAELLDSLNGIESSETDKRLESTSRKYRLYLNEVKSLGVKIEAELGRRKLKGFEDSILNLCRFYAKTYCYEYSDEAIKIFIKNRKSKSVRDNPYYSLYYLILVRYAIKHKLPIKFEYHNYNDYKKIKNRIVLPLGMSCKASHFFLFGVDLETGETKRFLYSCINEMYTDLEEAFSFPDHDLLRNFKKPKNIEAFLSEEYSSEALNEAIDFKIEFYGDSYRRLLKTYNFEKIQEIESNRDEGKRVLLIRSKNVESIYSMLFAIGSSCKLVEPKIWVNQYQNKLKSIQRQYR